MDYLYKDVKIGTHRTQFSSKTFEERKNSIDKNVEWEMSGIDRGIDNYNKQKLKDQENFNKIKKRTGQGRSAFADSDVGSKMVDNIMIPLVDEFKAIQLEAQNGLGSAGHSALWWSPMLCLKPEQLSAVTIRTVLGGVQPEISRERAFTNCALKISHNIKQQREFDLWKDRQSFNAKNKIINLTPEAKEIFKPSETSSVNLYQAMTKRCKKIDNRATRKFMRYATDLDRLEWSDNQKFALGEKCIHALVECGNGWFAIKDYKKNKGGFKTLKFVILTDIALQAIEADHRRCELNKPYLLPMICEPSEWRWGAGRSKYSHNQIKDPRPDGAIGIELKKLEVV